MHNYPHFPVSIASGIDTRYKIRKYHRLQCISRLAEKSFTKRFIEGCSTETLISCTTMLIQYSRTYSVQPMTRIKIPLSIESTPTRSQFDLV